MKKTFAGILLSLVIVIILVIFRFKPIQIIDYDGFVLPGNQLAENLFKDSLNKEEKIIKPIKVNAYDNIYKSHGKLFVGENKKVNINPIYPIFTNDKLAVVNLSEESTLIDSEFNFYEGYPNLTLTGGELYNRADLMRADEINYLFLKLSNSLYVNSSFITIETYTNNHTIDLNSIIYFGDNTIKYYEFSLDELIYKEINGVDLVSKIIVGNNELTYEEFLINLKHISEKQPEEEIIKEEDDDSNEVEEILYQMPEVSAGEFKTNVYSTTSSLKISDPSSVITTPIIFEVKLDGRIYLRRSFVSSGNFEISGLSPSETYQVRGYYNYINKEGREVERTFFNDSIRTKGLDTLPPVKISFENGPIYSSKIEIINFEIIEGLNTETLKGVRRVSVHLNDSIYNLNGNDISKLFNGEKITYTSPSNIPSNQTIDYEIVMSDSFGNNVVVLNNKSSTRTSKQIPSASVKVVENDIAKVTLGASLENKDNASISNFRFVVVTRENEIIKSGLVPKDGLIPLTNLDSNDLFSIYLYADYNIEDGNGTYKDTLIGETKFTSVPITSLGYIRLDLSLDEIAQETASISYSIDNNSTSDKLIGLLDRLNIKIIEKTNEIETIVYSSIISSSDITSLKQGNVLIEEIKNLSSSSTYYIEIDSIVKQGNKDYILNTLTNLKSFTTLKNAAEVLIINSFSTESIIDYDVKIKDEDLAILSGKVRLEVRDEANKIVRIENININDDYLRLTYDKLRPNHYYTFNYIAEEYNEGKDNTTFIENKIIHSYKVFTEVGISGDVSIISLLEKQVGKNLFNINNTIRWKSLGSGTDEKFIDVPNNTITFTAQNGYRNNSYYLIDYVGQVITVSFYAKRVEGTAPAYLTNTDSNSTTFAISNLTEEYKKYTYTFTLGARGYVGFNIRETSGNNSKTSIKVKELQIEKGNTATNYEDFISHPTYEALVNVNLNDTRDEITTNDYYVKIYRENTLTETNHYEIESENKVINKETTHFLNKNSNYQIDLVVKIRNREYVIASNYFTTEKEIRSIRSVSEFFLMHNNGRYIVTTDLDFRNNGNVYSAAFYGEIDFQGNQVIIAAQGGPSYLFHTIASTGKVKNIDLRIYLNNAVERSYYYGFNYRNYGIIENIMVTIEESNRVPNIITGTTSYVNYGIITNFVVNSKVSFKGARFFSPFLTHNYGTVKNGYLYGEPIDATFVNETSSTKRVGAVAAYTGVNSQIKNVFSLISVNTAYNGTSNDRQVGLLVGESNRGIIQNAYAVGEINSNNTSGDPNVGYVSGRVTASNLFYSSNSIYNSNYSQKISNVAVNDANFQNKVLNEENAFIVDELVNNGYYPQLNWPKSMPYQDLIELAPVEDSDLLDIISTEVIESNIESAEVMFDIHNPSMEVVTNISIKDASIRILSQETSKGKTTLYAIVENPIKYLSKYYVKSITSQSAFNIPYTRHYLDNERALYFDLYRRVDNIDDWKSIRESLSENYQLTSDLDFKYANNFLIGNFSGKLNGDNHTIKNIEINSGNGLFTTLSGEIKNLNVLNFKKNNASSYGGMIYNSSGVATVDNVHMKDVVVNATSYIGGIIGYGNGIIIKNSSVTNFKNNNAEELIDVRIGPIAGFITGGYVQNSFAQDVDINITDSVSTYGVGGLVGQLDGGIVENCYAVGKIKTNSSHAGGIVGLSSANISNVYSNVDIESELDYIGGIIGNSTNNYLHNTLALGNIYSSYITSYMNRTTGNKAPNQNNYALRTQLINGYESGHFYGENLISYDELLNESSYEVTINLGQYFDYTKSSEAILPKLMFTDGSSLLPNQIDNYLPRQKFEVLSVDTVKRMNDATILISFNNPDEVEVTEIEFDYLDILSINKIITENKTTTVEVIAEPTRALDTYKLNKIIYKENNEIKEFLKSVKLDLQFYKNIGSFEDWQKIDKSIPENYRLITDIDFEGKVNINTDVVIARLEGLDDGYTIKNLTISKNAKSQALIKTITTNLENVNFDNITIKNTRTSGNYNNIIAFSYADINKVNFTNIEIDAPRMAYNAPIARSRGYHISNINVENINVTGANYTAGLISYAFETAYNDINGKNITVTGAQYTGGLIGSRPYRDITTYYRFNVEDVTVTGTSYVGGIFGRGSSDDSTVKNAVVTGTSYVGGFSGYSYVYYTRDVEVRDTKVYGTTNYIGGVYGLAQYYHYNIFLHDSEVYGLNTTTNYVGGIMGHAGSYGMYNSGVLNSKIESNGNYVGGITGLHNGKVIYYSFVYNTSVTGLNNVGGIAGISRNTNLAYLTTNADVTATGVNAGGIQGYVANALTTNATNPIRVYYNIVAGGTIKAQNNAGGISGYVEGPIYNGHYYSNVVAANINTTTEGGSALAAIGNNRAYSSLINNLMVYDKLKINDETITNIPNNGLTENNLVTLNDLKTRTTYTSRGFTTARFEFEPLNRDKFPLLKANTGALTANQVELDLPNEEMVMGKSLNIFEFSELPSVNVYPVDVDKINIEFDKVDNFSTFTLKANDEVIYKSNIGERVYTFDYNFNTNFELLIENFNSQKIEIINKEDLRKKISTTEDGYYYIKDNKIISNKDIISGNFIHIYHDKAIDEDGNIHSLSNEKTLYSISSINKTDSKPLYKFSYDNYDIETYLNYSNIINSDNIKTYVDDILIVKNGKLSYISKDLSTIKTSIIIDSYGNKDYETMLGTNGVIYNLKELINVPNDFVNNNIKYFTSNLHNNSSFTLVYYEDGSVYGFDYRSGQKLFSDKTKKDISVIEYLKDKITKKPHVIDQNISEDYEEYKKLEEVLISNPLSKVKTKKMPDSQIKYVSKYDPVTKKFSIYDDSDLLNNNIISIEDKIIVDVDLINFYSNNGVSTLIPKKISMIKIFIFIVIAILISLLSYLRIIKYFKKEIKL